MNYKILSIAALVGVTAAANAQITLTGISAPKGSHAFSGTYAVDYTSVANSASFSVGQTAGTGGLHAGVISGWDFTAMTGPGHDITSIDFKTAVSSVHANSLVMFTATVTGLNGATFPTDKFQSPGGLFQNVIGLSDVTPTNSATYSGGIIDVHMDLSAYAYSKYEIKFSESFENLVTVGGVTTTATPGAVPEPASFATVGFGIAALFARRRRRA